MENIVDSGIIEQISLKEQNGKVRYSPLVPLNGNMFLCRIETPALSSGRIVGKDHFFVVYTKENNAMIPIGHIDFRVTEQKPETAFLYINLLTSIEDNSDKELPEHIAMISNSFKGDVDGFSVGSKFRGRGVGKFLYNLGRLLLKDEGVEKISIKGDLTRKEGGLGFYEKEGVSTNLTADQEKQIMSFFSSQS